MAEVTDARVILRDLLLICNDGDEMGEEDVALAGSGMIMGLRLAARYPEYAMALHKLVEEQYTGGEIRPSRDRSDAGWEQYVDEHPMVVPHTPVWQAIERARDIRDG